MTSSTCIVYKIYKNVAQENVRIFSATTPKAQFYPPIRLETTPKKSEKGKEAEEREKKELAYLVLLYCVL